MKFIAPSNTSQVGIKMKVIERDEDGSLVEFIRTGGPSLDYYELVKKLVKFLGQVESNAVQELESALEQRQ